MNEQDWNGRPIDRRKHTRWSVYNFLHATATLSESIEAINQNQPEQCWTGLIVDISPEGAQVVLPRNCAERFTENQQIAMRIKISFLEKIKVDIIARVKSVVPDRDYNGLCIGVQFTGLESNAEARCKIRKICEYGRKLHTAETT